MGAGGRRAPAKGMAWAAQHGEDMTCRPASDSGCIRYMLPGPSAPVSGALQGTALLCIGSVSHIVSVSLCLQLLCRSPCLPFIARACNCKAWGLAGGVQQIALGFDPLRFQSV